MVSETMARYLVSLRVGRGSRGQEVQGRMVTLHRRVATTSAAESELESVSPHMGT